MKAAELRIGNWYTHIGGKSHTDIQINIQLMMKIFNGSDLEYSLDDFQDIPLTEEWLVKFGFEKNSTEKTHDSWRLEIDIKGGNTNEIVFHITKIEEVEDWGSYVVNNLWAANNFEYVHQLQNLFHALTGKEIEAL